MIANTGRYTQCIQNSQKAKKGVETQKTAITPYLEPNQSTKSNMDKEQSPINTQTHSTKIYKNEYLITRSIFSQFSKAIQFLSLQIVQNKYNGAPSKLFSSSFLQRTSINSKEHP